MIILNVLVKNVRTTKAGEIEETFQICQIPAEKPEDIVGSPALGDWKNKQGDREFFTAENPKGNTELDHIYSDPFSKHQNLNRWLSISKEDFEKIKSSAPFEKLSLKKASANVSKADMKEQMERMARELAEYKKMLAEKENTETSETSEASE